MYSQEDFQNVVNQLKTKIAEGKVTCFKCHFPVGGEGIKQIDMINARITYLCNNHLCENKSKSGFRSFKALDIVVPSIAPPAELSSIVAPAPPRPEEVPWSSEEGVIGQSADADDDDDDPDAMIIGDGASRVVAPRVDDHDRNEDRLQN